MADALSQRMGERVEELCREISVAHTLDAEIHEELRGHMEDKLLAYLNGQEVFTEEDAYVLVREHFGHRDSVKSLLKEVHAVDMQISLARRFAAIIAVHLVYASLTSLCFVVVWSCAAWLKFMGEQTPLNIGFYPGLMVLFSVVSTLLFWRVLLEWQRRHYAGEMLWFQRWNGARIVILLGVLYLGLAITPNVQGSDLATISPLTAEPLFLNSLWICVSLATGLAQILIWLWWCDFPPRRARAIVLGALTWLIFAVVPIQLVHLDVYAYEPLSQAIDFSNQIVLWREQGAASTGIWAVRAGDEIGKQYYLLSVFMCVAMIVCALPVYLRMIRRRPPTGGYFPKAAA